MVGKQVRREMAFHVELERILEPRFVLTDKSDTERALGGASLQGQSELAEQAPA